MRKWGELSGFKKLKRTWYGVNGFLSRYVWGGYQRGGICGAYHWIRCHVWNRYHLIDLRGQGGYDWGWIDRCEAMRLACFKLLVDYVEKERPFEGAIDWEYNETHSHAAKEIRELYEWWVRGRRAEQDALYAMDVGNYTGSAWRAWCARYDELEEKDDAMLDRLIAVRPYLWT